MLRFILRVSLNYQLSHRTSQHVRLQKDRLKPVVSKMFLTKDFEIVPIVVCDI